MIQTTPEGIRRLRAYGGPQPMQVVRSGQLDGAEGGQVGSEPLDVEERPRNGS